MHAPWTGYRGSDHPDKIRLKHRKTNELALHPLEYVDEEDGELVRLYADAEDVLSKTPRYGTSIVCKKNGQLSGDGTFLAHEVREIADLLRDEGKLSAQAFSLDMCRHGGMTELQESGLTEGQGRALSKHKTAAAYRGYAKETEKRVVEATKKRFGHSEQPKIINENNVSKKEKKARYNGSYSERSLILLDLQSSASPLRHEASQVPVIEPWRAFRTILENRKRPFLKKVPDNF
ncbi:hypothetical protein [Rhizobium mongolense]